MAKLPKILYKYRSLKSEFTEDIITNNIIHYSSPVHLNDPHDVYPYVKPLTEDEKQQLFQSYGFSEEDIKKGLPNLHQHTLHQMVQATLAQISIFSLSKTCKSILMWSHYADGHYGICFGFDISADRDSFKNPVSVKYQNERAIIDVTKLQTYEDSDLQQIREALTIKYKQWKYEKEVRCFAQFDNPDKNLIYKDEALREVIFGWQVPEYKRIEIAKLCKAYHKEVDFYGMVMVNGREFRFEPERLDYLKKV